MPLLLLLAALVAQAVPDPQPERAQAPAAIVPPRPVGEPVAARYPPGTSGNARVVLQIDVDAQGNVAGAQVVSPPQSEFDESALEAARRLRFEPARQGDTPIAVRIQYAFNFVAPAPVPAREAPVSLSGVVRERGTR